MHIDIGLPSVSMIEHRVLPYNGYDHSDYTISDFNGTFPPFGQAIARNKSVYIGKDVHLILRIIYLYLYSLKEFQDWCWGISEISEETRILYNRVETNNISILSLDDLCRILPSMSKYSDRDIEDIYSWYTTAKDIKYMHQLYTETRSLLLKFPPARDVLRDLVSDDQYVSSNTCDFLLSMEIDGQRLLHAIFLTYRFEYLDRVLPTEDTIEVVQRESSFVYDIDREILENWLREAYVLVPSVRLISPVSSIITP